MKQPNTRKTAFLLSAAALLAAAGLKTLADYPTSVLAQGPLAYWRLNETSAVPSADAAVNAGSLGAAATGYYVGAASHPVPGALAIGTDTAASYDATAGTVTAIPYMPELNPSSAFTIEAWLNPGVQNAAGTLTCALSSGNFASPRSGWLIYQSDTGWNLRMYAQNGTATSVNITGTPAPVPGVWSHVVAVYDGTTARVYVDGVQTASAPVPAYVSGRNGQMYIGGRSDASFWWNGQADEVAFYDKALTAAEVAAHHQNGISTAPSTPYNQLVAASGPLAYYRLSEPAYTPPTVLPAAANLGSLGAAGDASYNAGAQAGTPGPAYSGFGANNLAPRFNGLAGYVGTPVSLNDFAQLTIMGWIKRGTVHSGRGGYFGQNDLMEFGDADGGANIEAWSSASGQIKVPYPFKDDQWGFLALVGDGTKLTLYADGLPISSINSTVASYGNSTFPFNIGGGGVFNAAGDYFAGSIDEVAVFDKALTAQQILDTFLSANVPPWITKQPTAPTRDIYAGNVVTLTVAAGGNPPLSYQWRKGTSELPGQTSSTLTFSSITEADSGAYNVVVSNPFGSVTSSSVTLTVKPAETTAPTVLYAAGNQQFNGVRVWFSEPLDPVSAQVAANYQLSGGVTVTSAKLSAAAGGPGDNIVDLVTSAQSQGTTYTLTINNVKDQVVPANTIAANTTVQFSSCVVSPGVALFEIWTGLSTSDNSIANTLLKDPRFPNAPTTSTFTSALNSRVIYPDDSHEGYGGKMSALLRPTRTTDYFFFLRSDDSSRLYLSSNADPAGKNLIAEEVGCCAAFLEPDPGGANWRDNGSGIGQTTLTPIRLVAGQQYYIEAIWKEGTGGDYCQVAWRASDDGTAAGDLQPISGTLLQSIVDPNVDLAFPQQPTDQVGIPASTSITLRSVDFATGDGGFTVVNTDPAPPGPWVFNGTSWTADGAESGCTGPYNSQLNSPTNNVTQSGTLMLTFKHRYSFESGLWDAGQVRISVNGGAFTLVPAENFLTNGYAVGNIIGTGIALGSRAFNGDSPGYNTPEYITSQAILGGFNAGDRVVVQFVGAWDDCSTQGVPSWEIQNMTLDLLVGAQQSTFTATATGARRGDPVGIQYQWQRNDGGAWVNIAGATANTLRITPNQVDMKATFRVMVTAYGIPGKVIYSNVVKLVPPGPPEISIAKSGNNITITYTGTLQSATTVKGTYTPVTGAQSPYTVPATAGALFFRSVK